MSLVDLFAPVLIALIVATALRLHRAAEAVGADEGYLWYGCLRVAEGQVPHRDFKSYEPGRYVWCAAWMTVLGPALESVRTATHAFYFLGLASALSALARAGADTPTLLLAAALLGTWALPQHKLYEPAWMMLAFTVACWFVTDPAPGSALACGVVAGLALFFGFNLFLYVGAAIALLALHAWALGRGTPGWPAPLAAGMGLGAAPFIAGFVSDRAFRASFLERRVLAVLRRGTSNLPLPVPWPWRRPAGIWQQEHALRRRAIGVLFVLLLLIPAATLALLSLPLAPLGFHGPQAALLAASALAAIGWHHAFSRADLPHLAQSIVPLLLISIAASLLLPLPARSGVLVVLLLISLFLVWPQIAAAARQRRNAPERGGQGSAHGVPLSSGQQRLVQRAIEAGEDGSGSLLALPTLAWLYPVLREKAPVYDIFGVWPASDQEQDRLLLEIARNPLRLAVIANHPLDGRQELRFSATHPRVWAHLTDHFDVLAEDPKLPDLHFFTARTSRFPGRESGVGAVPGAVTHPSCSPSSTSDSA